MTAISGGGSGEKRKRRTSKKIDLMYTLFGFIKVLNLITNFKASPSRNYL